MSMCKVGDQCTEIKQNCLHEYLNQVSISYIYTLFWSLKGWHNVSSMDVS